MPKVALQTKNVGMGELTAEMIGNAEENEHVAGVVILRQAPVSEMLNVIVLTQNAANQNKKQDAIWTLNALVLANAALYPATHTWVYVKERLHARLLMILVEYMKLSQITKRNVQVTFNAEEIDFAT